MRLWWRKPKNIVTVTVWPTTLSVYHFIHTSPRITLKNSWHYHSNEFSCDNLALGNISKFSDLLRTHAHTLNAPLLIGLRGYQLQENMSATITKNVTDDTFDFPSSHTHQYGYQYMYPHNDTQHMFYTWHIPHHILFSYQLAAHMSNQQLIDVIPYQSALFNAYTQYKYPAFRIHELARDMQQYRHSIEHYFQKESVYRLVQIATTIDHNDYLSLLHAAGMVFSLKEAS